MPSPMVVAEPSPEEKDLAQSLLNEMLTTRNRRDELELRHQLKSLVVTAVSAGADFNLSDPSTELGRLMAQANQRARERGWL